MTQNVQYEAPRNYPPSIESAPAAMHPLNSVIQLPIELGSSSDDGGTSTAMSIPLSIDVRDPNLDQRLRYRVFIDFNPTDPRMPELEIDIPPTQPTADDRLTRRVEITLPISGRLSLPGCHRIEVFVAGLPEGFQNAPNGRLPRLEGDLATATWWVARQPDEGGPVDMTGCP
ncbi:MAG: hypothetical protein M3Y87_13885 [Myxococcota bacterium]|nr:hypothetical protein [Myxococcota bacterium]